jgi:hypothetical protein
VKAFDALGRMRRQRAASEYPRPDTPHYHSGRHQRRHHDHRYHPHQHQTTIRHPPTRPLPYHLIHHHLQGPTSTRRHLPPLRGGRESARVPVEVVGGRLLPPDEQRGGEMGQVLLGLVIRVQTFFTFSRRRRLRRRLSPRFGPCPAVRPCHIDPLLRRESPEATALSGRQGGHGFPPS